MYLSKALQILLIDLEIGIGQFAKETGISPHTIWQVKKKMVRELRPNTIGKIQEIYGYELNITYHFICLDNENNNLVADSSIELLSLLLSTLKLSKKEFCQEIDYSIKVLRNNINYRESYSITSTIAAKIKKRFGYEYSKTFEFVKISPKN